MNKGHFYFIKNQYFIDFPDPNLMINKETIEGKDHNRPCYYAFEDSTTGLLWLIPLSSQLEKYHRLYNNKIKKYKHCDTIVFGELIGYEKAFLIQNMFPITENYIKNEYIKGSTNTPVSIQGNFEKKLIHKAKKVLALQRQGVNLILPNVLNIEKQLLHN